MADRAAVVEELRPRFVEHAAGLGLRATPEVAYRPRSKATDGRGAGGRAGGARRRRRRARVHRHGPHRDDLVLRRDGRELRAYGSRGQQRLGLLALLLAERGALADSRGAPPLMLLDDVMSELDAGRREQLVDLLRDGGQSLITTTDLAHVPGADGADVSGSRSRGNRAAGGRVRRRGPRPLATRSIA